MKEKGINSLIFIIFIILFITRDKIYLYLDNDIFYPELIFEEYYNNEDICLKINDLSYNYLYTRILYRDIYKFNEKITIYKGIDNGIKENMAVVNELGLVGIIDKTSDNTSEVKLLTNDDINLSVKTENSYGYLKYEDGNLIVTNLTSKEDIKNGSEITTSGLGNQYEGILIGKVVKKDENYLNDTYIIESYVNFNELNYLAVILDVK